MERTLSACVAAALLLALPGCGWVKVEEEGAVSGLFSISQAPPDHANVWAGFRKITDHGDDDWRVEVAHEGPCSLVHYAPPPSSPPELPAQLDAGKLRVTGGLKELVADYDDESDKYEFAQEKAVFEAGDVLTFDIEGTDRVPSMSVSIPAPETAIVSAPPETIDTTQDLTFAWTSASGKGTVTIQVLGFYPAHQVGSTKGWSERDAVVCEVPLAQGTLTMPTSLLSQLVTDPQPGLHIMANAQNTELRSFGDSFVGFVVSAIAMTPDGTAYLHQAKMK
jgi:hypothetical protein